MCWECEAQIEGDVTCCGCVAQVEWEFEREWDCKCGMDTIELEPFGLEVVVFEKTKEKNVSSNTTLHAMQRRLVVGSR